MILKNRKIYFQTISGRQPIFRPILTNFLLKRPDEDINFLNWMENTALTELILEKESHTYQLVRLNDYPHLRELQTIGYEKWGLFAEREYWVKQPGF